MGHTMKLLIARKASSQSKEEAVSVHIYVYRLGVGPMWYALIRRVQLLRNAFLCNCNASALFRNRTALCVMLILLEGFAAPVKTACCKDSTSHLSALQKVRKMYKRRAAS